MSRSSRAVSKGAEAMAILRNSGRRAPLQGSLLVPRCGPRQRRRQARSARLLTLINFERSAACRAARLSASDQSHDNADGGSDEQEKAHHPLDEKAGQPLLDGLAVAHEIDG